MAVGSRNKHSADMSRRSSEAVSPELVFETRLYSKVTWRLMPFLFLCYVFAYLDRVNVGFAKLQMQQDLRISDAVYGAGAGIFFIGYFLFEVPCNLMLQRIGAKRWLGPIMIIWGVVSACNIFIRDTRTFYALRFSLGVVESGFFPGVILYLTFWFTFRYRPRMLAVFLTAIPVSSVIGAPISGWILKAMSTAGGLRGWQWLLVLEAVPSIIAGVAALVFLDDGPRTAKWLSEEERAFLVARLEEDQALKQTNPQAKHTMRDAFSSPACWLMCAIYFGLVMGNYGLAFWLPQIVKDSLTKDPLLIGFLTAIPWGCGVIAMLVVGHHSDRTGERRWHIALTGALGAAAFACSAFPQLPGALVLAALAVATAGITASYSTFWALPSTLLSGTAASAGIALVNSVGNLAGYCSPYLVGLLRDKTHSMVPALLMLAACCLASAVLTVIGFRERRSDGVAVV